MKYHVKILNVNIEIDLLIWKMFIYIKWPKKTVYQKELYVIVSFCLYVCW